VRRQIGRATGVIFMTEAPAGVRRGRPSLKPGRRKDDDVKGMTPPPRSSSETIPVAGPWVTERELALVAEAARTAWYGGAGEFIERFERAFAAHVGTRHALALPSCTAGLHLALAALGVGEGDEVVVPDITWIATAAPVSYVGARPVFADVDPRTWCVTASAVEACLTSRTRAIVVVDLYGGTPHDLSDLRALAAARGLPLIEDAAEAIGALNGGRRAGALGDVGVFSFHGSKTLTTGEGGMLVTDRTDLWRRARKLADHGRADGPRLFWNDEVAFKYKMSALQAAFGLGQLERVDALVARKREIFGWYVEELAPIRDRVALNFEPPGTTNGYWMTTAVIDEGLALDKDRVLAELAARGVDARPFFHPLSTLPAYAGTAEAHAARRRNHVALSLGPRGINLPSALSLTRAQVARAAAAFRDIVEQATSVAQPALRARLG